jgi:hypothetical protein
MNLSSLQRLVRASASQSRPGAVALGLVLLWAGSGPLPGAEAQNPYLGRFKGGSLTILIQGNADQFQGTLEMGANRYPFTARTVDGRLKGAFQSDGDSFDFEAKLQDSVLLLTSSGTTYRLEREPAKNPLAQGPRPNPLAQPPKLAEHKTEVSPAQTNQPAQPAGGPGGGPVWKEYRHPTGLRLTYPPDWQLRPLPSGLQLIPPDPGSNADGPAEVYLVAAESAEGVTSIEDPRVLAYLDLQISRLAPFLQRAGPGEKIPCATAPGLRAQWEGKNVKGLSVQAQGFATILKGCGVVLFALGEQARLKTRDAALRKMFSSFAAGEGQKDPQLVGKWQFWSYTSTSDGSFGTERSRVMALKSDGTCAWFSRSESSGTFKEKDSLGDSKWVAGVAGSGSGADTGAWSAGDGKLFIQWKDGSIGQWDYTLSGVPGNRRLLLKGDQKKPDEWVEAR